MFENLHKSYLDIFKNHTGFASDKWIHYFFIYDQLFSRFRKPGKPITLLEIGVQNGGSLEIWKKYLPENSTIYGIDIDEKCADLRFSKNINFYPGSATDNNFMDTTFGDMEFDVIIDDGSHVCSDVITTFTTMFPKIKPGGMYIVEDLHTSYWKSYGGSFRGHGSSIEFFKKITDALNFDYLEKDETIDEGEITSLREYSNIISSISFFDSICAINKFYQKKDEGFQAGITGDIQFAFDTSFKPKILQQHKLIKTIETLYNGASSLKTLSLQSLHGEEIPIDLIPINNIILHYLDRIMVYAARNEGNDFHIMASANSKTSSVDTHTTYNRFMDEFNKTISELSDTQAELNYTKSELYSTKSELNDSRTKLKDTQSELNNARAELNATGAVLNDTKAELNRTQTEINELKESESYRLGKKILFLPRIIKMLIENDKKR